MNDKPKTFAEASAEFNKAVNAMGKAIMETLISGWLAFSIRHPKTWRILKWLVGEG